MLTLTLTGLVGCGSAPSPQAISEQVRARLPEGKRVITVRGERLLEPEPVSRFYAQRKARQAWPQRGDAKQIVQAIRAIEQDGLTPADYHLEAIDSLLSERDKVNTPEHEADLDILLTDAVAGLVDHMRYGRVRPVMLDRRWNVNPREGAPPLEETIARVVNAGSVGEAIQAERLQHFIYRGLVGALAQLREIESKGGWPVVPAGRPIKPEAVDSRIPGVRARLAVSGELPGREASDSTRYDTELRKAVELFQARHRLDANGVIDKNTVAAMNVPVGDRIAQVRVNLERARWVLGGLQDDFMLVNLPAFKAYLIRGGKNQWEARTQIGQEARQTPSFRADMRTVVINPDWTVPPTILAEDVLEGMRMGVNMIERKKLVILDPEGNQVDPGSVDWEAATPETFPYTLRQPPGDDNALGRVKFLFPNKYSIYLHDTPSRELFEADRRTFSSGCIRLENALELANLLLSGQDGWTPDRINSVVASGKTDNVALAHPLPVLIVYWTVSVGATGEIRYMNDVYERDPPVLAALGTTPTS